MSKSSGYSWRSAIEQEVHEAMASYPCSTRSLIEETLTSAWRRASSSIPFANIGVPEHFCSGTTTS